MPIARELRRLYQGPEWAAARRRILERARGRCEQCKKPSGPVFTYTWQIDEMEGLERIRRYYMAWATPRSRAWRDQFGRIIPRDEWPAEGLPRKIIAEISVAHLHPDGGFLDDNNLRALCQWCHCHLDQWLHRQSRSTRKDRGRPMLSGGAL